MLKALSKKVVDSIAASRSAFLLFDGTIGALGRYARVRHAKHFHEGRRYVLTGRELALASEMFPDLRVGGGVFRGMRYPEFASYGSAIFPKFLGFYESEWTGLLGSLLTQEYNRIYDIGCAEGYFAVGLARMYPEAQVFAYDTSKDALNMCQEIARINGVHDRIELNGFLSPEVFAKERKAAGCFILCDCDGYELQLFSEEVVRSCHSADLLIEVHDHIDLTISSVLTERFQESHEVTRINALTDYQRLRANCDPKLKELDLEERFACLAEGRGAGNDWLLMRPRARQFR